MKRKVIFILSVLVCCLSFSIGAQARNDSSSVPSGLTKQDGKIYYYNNDGTFYTNGFKTIDIDGMRYYYYFTADGTAYTDGFLALEQDGHQYYYYFNEDGTAFTDGFKKVDADGTRGYYYFTADGSAYTDGYLSFVRNGRQYYYYFNEDGTAFTEGLKEVIADGEPRYFFFLSNGQAFRSGYKAVETDGKTSLYYFDSNGRAAVNTVRQAYIGEKVAYLVLKKDGKAYTGGLTSVVCDGEKEYYYCNSNGFAYTGGWKKITSGTGSGSWYFFRPDGTAQTESWLSDAGKWYYLKEDGKAARNEFLEIDGIRYYFGSSCAMCENTWIRAGSAFYYATDSGELAANTVVEGYRIDETGKCPTKYRIVKFIEEIVDDTMTDQEKIEAIYDWILYSDMVYISNIEHTHLDWTWADGWTDDYAVDVMEDYGGNCFRYAAFLGFCIKEATYLPVKVYHGETLSVYAPTAPHGWTCVLQDGHWYSYDIEQNKFDYEYPRERVYHRLFTETYGDIYFKGEGVNLY